MDQINRDNEGLLRDITCFALDMDGTFYLSNTLLEGSLDFLEALRERGKDFVFLTNNSSKSRAAYLDKLAAMGVKVAERNLVTSGLATIRWLQKHHPGEKVFLLGNDVLYGEFIESGIILDSNAPDLVVTAFDTTLDYQKMTMLCDFVRGGLPYIATHPDYNCPVEGGGYIPDIGAIHAFVEASTGRMPDCIIGKPNREILDCALAQTGHRPEQTAMVGDRLYTDIASTANLPGLTGILVLTGESGAEGIETAEVKPHLVFDRLSSMIPYL